MSRARIDLDVARGESFEILVDGRPVAAYEGESIAAALIAAGIPATRRSPRLGEPRGYFCGMGVCWECAVRVDGGRLERACMQRVRPGMRVGIAGDP
jgi:sarcosine oxidase subunit alpha